MEPLTAMKDAISDVLETMFFVMVDFEGDPMSDPFYYCESHIALYGEKSTQMSIHVRIVESFAKVITANFLGKAEDDIVSEDIEDTVKELTNMIGGNYIARTDRRWRLGIPMIRKTLGETPDGKASVLSLFCLNAFVGMVILQSDS